MKTRFLLITLCFSWGIFAQENSWVEQTIYRSGQNSQGQNNIPSSLPLTKKTYLDGFGRPIQIISHQQSEVNQKNIIQHIQYDDYGREAIKYLPYSSNVSNLEFVNGADQETLNYLDYQNQNPTSEIIYEESPLSRVLKVSAPGVSWKMGSGHEVSYEYSSNNINDDVIEYENQSDKLMYVGTIQAGSLFKRIITDENGNKTEEYKNTKGQLILKRQFDNSTPIDTYYVFDFYGNLSFVVPPAYNKTNYQQYDQTIIDNLCYQYRYDDKNRIIEKKEPGKQWQYIVYDALDRIVATGPAYHPYGSNDTVLGWLYNQYDAQGRIAMTGWFNDSFSANNDNTLLRDALQNNYNGQIVYTTKTAAPNNFDGINIQYSTNDLPTGLMLLSVHYYDDYNFPNAPNNFTNPSPITEINQQVYYDNDQKKPKGLPTGSWVRVLTDAAQIASGETSSILYDYRGRSVIVLKTNHLDGYTKSCNLLNFDGSIKYSATYHKKSNNASDIPIFTKNIYNYTQQGRVESIYHQIGESSTPYRLVENQYEPLGKLITKKVGQLPDNNYFQIVNYAYNIRGWLTKINDVNNLVVDPHDIDLFAYKINYDTTENNVPNTSAQYNGGISETYWRTSSDNNLRKYSYRYDDLNRMIEAVYQKPFGASSLRNSYNEKVSYDLNGNISDIHRNGNLDIAGETFEIDNLNYSYQNNSNKLLAVNDTSGSSSGFKEAQTTLIDYDYDANGNLTKDKNKNIQTIIYNHLNLPTQIKFNNGQNIVYQYTSDGEKVAKLVTRASTTSTTDYLDGFQYFKGDLQFFPTSEGYVSANKIEQDNYAFNYVFNYTDHLGNIRVSYGLDPKNSQIKILEENHYYPFGLKHNNYNSNIKAYAKDDDGNEVSVALKTPVDDQGILTEYTNKYKFNGMEYQDELGLNLYDMDMRDYDPAIGRWTGIDPVTHFNQSPYCAFDNNPVSFADPSGADGIGGGGVGGETYSSVFGMQVGTPNSTGMNIGYSIGESFGALSMNVGPAWGDGGILPYTSIEGFHRDSYDSYLSDINNANPSKNKENKDKNVIGPTVPEPMNYNTFYFEKQNNNEYIKYVNIRVSTLKKVVQLKKKEITKIQESSLEIEKNMSEASDGTGGDKGMAFGSIARGIIDKVRIGNLNKEINRINREINRLLNSIIKYNSN